MTRSRIWLLVAIVVVAAALYVVVDMFVRTSGGPAREGTPDDGVARQARQSEIRSPADVPAGGESSAPLGTPGAEERPAPEVVELDLGGRVQISGRVRSPDGQPLSGATVWSGSAEEEVTMGQDGAFLITGLESGTYMLIAEHPRYARTLAGPFTIRANRELRRVEIRLIEPGFISGTVSDENGAPTEFDELKFERLDGENETSQHPSWARHFRVYGSYSEEPVGRYLSSPLPPGRYSVKAWHPDWICDQEHTVVVFAGHTVENVNFVFDPGVTITGRVLDAGGQPVWGATVFVSGISLASAGMARSDEQGFFCLRGLRPGEHSVDAFAQGFVRYRALLTAPAAGVEIVLDRGARIGGRVIDKITREPVESYRLDIRPQTPIEALADRASADWLKRSREYGHASSYGEHPGGRFSHTGFNPWTYWLEIETDDHLPLAIHGIEVKDGADPEELLIELLPGAVVEVRVTSAADGSPVDGAAVIPDDWRPQVLDGLPHFPTTDAEGVCVLKPYAPGEHEWSVRHDRFQDRAVRFELAPDERRKTISVVLESGLSVDGFVVAKKDGAPIEGACVTLGGRSDYEMQTDETGRFSFGAVDRGRYLLTVSAFGFATLRRALELSESPQEELLVELGRGGEIAGTVTAADGTPVEGARIEVRTPIRNVYFEGDIRTDSDGKFSVATLAPGAYRIAVLLQRDGWSEGSLDTRRVVVREGQVARADFALGGGVAVFGHITYGGEPVTRCSVNVSSTDGALYRTGIRTAWGQTDEQGAYRIEGLSLGRYVFAVNTALQDFDAGYDDVTCGLEVAGEDAELSVELAADVVAGVVKHADGAPSWMAKVELVPLLEGETRVTAINSVGDRERTGFETNKQGEFRIEGVAPGRYRLYVRPVTLETTTVVDLNKEAGRDITDLVVTLGDAELVQARATTEDGRVPEHVDVAVSDLQGRFLQHGGGPVDPETGQFPVAHLEPGDYTVLARATGCGLVRTSLHVEAGRETVVDFTFAGGHELVVRTEDVSGNPVAGANVIIDLDVDFLITADTYGSRLYARSDTSELFLATDETGCKRFAHVADGEYTIRVRCEGYEDAAVPVRIAGSDEEVTVTLRPRGE
jgi:protocatechuate 3,4-dioxygenase beta subunit